MKELSSHLKDDTKEKTSAQIPKQTEYALMGTIKPKPGQKVFEFNLSTGECREAQYKNSNADFMRAAQGDYSPVKDLVVLEGCLYLPALNRAIAEAKFAKSRIQSDYYKKVPPMSFNDHFINHNAKF